MPRHHRLLPAAAIATLALSLPAASQTAKKGPETLLYIDLATHDMPGMPNIGGLGKMAMGLFGGRAGLFFVLLENGLHARLVELQWLALVGLAQALDQSVELKAGHFVTQAFTQAGAKAVRQVVVGGGCFRVGPGQRRCQAQAENKITRHGQLLLR